jgi:ABC-2 type transport system permease protein
MRAELSFLRALVSTNLRSALALRGSFLLSMTFMAVNNATFFVFWWILLSRVGHLRGWQIPEVELLFGISAAGFGLMQVTCGGAMHLSRFIDEGALDPLLVQPRATLPYVLGSRSQASGFGDLLSGVAFVAHAGYLTPGRAPLVLVAVVASCAAFTATCVVFFSLAFWVRETHSLSRQLVDVVITFSLYPEPLFGGVLKVLLFTALPAGLVGYLPASVVREPSWLRALVLLAVTTAYLLVATRVFRAGLARYSSGSRFGMFG